MQNEKSIIQEGTSLIVIDETTVKEYVTIAKSQNNNSESILTLFEQEMLILRFGLFGEKVHSYHEIGKIYGVSHERVRQLIVHSINKIQKYIIINQKKEQKQENILNTLEKLIYGGNEKRLTK